MSIGKILIGTLLVTCNSVMAIAQLGERGRTEVFAGYSVMKTRYEAEVPDPPTPVIVAFDGRQTLHGFNASVTQYIEGGFGLTADVSGHFRSESMPTSLGGSIDSKIRVWNVLGGPQYKFRRGRRIAPFVHTLAGVASTRSSLTVTALNSTDSLSSTDFAMAIGGGLDVNVTDHIGIRVIQVDYNPIFLSSGNQLGFGSSRADNLRLSIGVVFK